MATGNSCVLTQLWLFVNLFEKSSSEVSMVVSTFITLICIHQSFIDWWPEYRLTSNKPCIAHEQMRNDKTSFQLFENVHQFLTCPELWFELRHVFQTLWIKWDSNSRPLWLTMGDSLPLSYVLINPFINVRY